MNGFVQYTPVDAPLPSRTLLRRTEREKGFVPNLIATCAESPALLQGLLALDGCLAQGTLPPAEREIAMLTVSLENGCAYCAASHSTMAQRLHASPPILDALRAASPIPEERACALVRFVRLVMRCRGFISEAEVRGLLAAGYTRAQMLELLGLIALKTGHNYIHALTAPPLDAAFEAQRWDAIRVPLA